MTVTSQNLTIQRKPQRTSKSHVVIHFAGDSGDGMQVAGQRFTQTCAEVGNDIRTLPDFPAEIRAPAGTIPGVSGFQIQFSAEKIYTAGDEYDVLVAMNPAALQQAVTNTKKGGLILIDQDKFNSRETKKAGLSEDPLESGALSDYRVISLPVTTLTLEATKELSLSRGQARKCKNMFVLGVVSWLYDRPLENIKQWVKQKFASSEAIVDANIEALRVGYNYALTAELFSDHYTVRSADLPKGKYRQITGNQAVALGCAAFANRSNTKVLACGYPITPASDIMQELSRFNTSGVATFQAEDEIAAIGAALGAAYGGNIGVTFTSGPGLDLKMETMGLAQMAELPLVIVDVQRAGPSTGMPTKVEQSDLLAAINGRHGESPVPVIAANSPGDCFYKMQLAFKIAVEYMTPVIVLSDAGLANSTEPWQIPDVADLEKVSIEYCAENTELKPYARNENLARPWIKPGTKGLMHCIGGLEKQHETGKISYTPDNHQQMVTLRQQKIDNVQKLFKPLYQHNPEADSLIVGWGSTHGVIQAATNKFASQGVQLSSLHIECLYPLADDLQEILSKYKNIFVVELNSGQLCQLIRNKFLVDAKPINQISGQPFSITGLMAKIQQGIDSSGN